jgi:hypothetical protein
MAVLVRPGLAGRLDVHRAYGSSRRKKLVSDFGFTLKSSSDFDAAPRTAGSAS